MEEIPERSIGRERWWRSLPFSPQTPDPAKMAPRCRCSRSPLPEGSGVGDRREHAAGRGQARPTVVSVAARCDGRDRSPSSGS
jgi:hypothetical protein